MRSHPMQWTALILLSCATVTAKARSAPPPARKLAGYKAAAIGLAGSSIRGFELAGKAAEQRARAEANWKRLGLDKVPFLETEHLLVFGQVKDRPLKEVAAALEKHYVLAATEVDLEAADPWPGKLTVYLFAERAKFASFIRQVEKRRPEAEDLGSFAIRSDFPHVVAGPPHETGDPGLEVQASAQIAAALVTKRAGTDLPEWVIAGFGRATSLRARPPREQVAERKRAAGLLLSSRATAMSVWDGTVDRAQAAVLRGSLMDYLAYGPGKALFTAFLEGFKPDEGATQKTTADALKAANIDPQVLNKKWKIWARRAR